MYQCRHINMYNNLKLLVLMHADWYTVCIKEKYRLLTMNFHCDRSTASFLFLTVGYLD